MNNDDDAGVERKDDAVMFRKNAEIQHTEKNERAD